ncbi:MAG: acetoacetate--CoA ligase [Chloroflexus sp.]|uniref:acetoacetate--CoA ligase n=1 Tax=Chloroflexus sp. TaxID=1904827 RepID=UPI003D130D25
MTTAPRLLWEPPTELRDHCTMRTFMHWLAQRYGLHFDDYHRLYHWSVNELETFWSALWEYYHIKAYTPSTTVLSSREMPGARWFVGARLNYAEHVFRHATPDRPAVIVASERQPPTPLSWAELQAQTAAIAQTLRNAGVGPGDRVVAYVPNTHHALIGCLATASLGAIWSSCSPDFGSPSVIDRFSQIAPKVLIAVDGYQYGGKPFDRRAEVAAIQAALPSLELTIGIAYLNPTTDFAGLRGPVVRWEEVVQTSAELHFTPVEFNEPLWVLYSSGTTGLPKPIVHSQGGILLEHIKSLDLHFDMRPGDTFFWYTTTGWMMWNFLIGGLLIGAVPILYDGSPAYPDMGVLWRLAEQTKMRYFGTSAGYITALMKSGLEPRAQFNLSTIKAIGSTGSPLPPEGFEWVYDHIKHDVWLVSYSGGTDVCSGFVGGCPLLPVYSGEIQCRTLGCKAEAYDTDGHSVIGVMGELVITAPMPSMPIYFWNDPDYTRYKASYFEQYPGVWRHGDWIVINERGGVVIYGRSDSTINRQGIRIGTSEIYRAVETIPEVLDSLVIDLEGLGGRSYMPLFVVLREGVTLDDDLRQRIKQTIRTNLSPRHVPDDIFQIDAVPVTLSGKKLEVPIKKILLGVPVEQAANPDSLRNPESLQFFVRLAQTFAANKPA